MLCKEGKVYGAKKEGNSWLILINTDKPMDGRITSGYYVKKDREMKMPLPIGVSDYRLASTENYYVDKTLMIKDFIDEKLFVTLFTRPRRFGKTLNMDMFRTFFEISEKDNSIYLENKKIWHCGTKYQAYQVKYPVIFITFKDVKYNTWPETYEAIKEIISIEAARHLVIKDSPYCNDYEKEDFEKLLSGNLTEIELSNALLNVSIMLDKHYNIPSIIIIDEYDVPIQQSYIKRFYDQTILFMRNLFSAGLKDTRHLSFGLLTGVLRVSKENIFSG